MNLEWCLRTNFNIYSEFYTNFVPSVMPHAQRVSVEQRKAVYTVVIIGRVNLMRNNSFIVIIITVFMLIKQTEAKKIISNRASV